MTETFSYGDGMLVGEITVNEQIDSKIQSGEIQFVSCDFWNLQKEGLVFVGLSLLTKGNPPADKLAMIFPKSRRELTVMEESQNPITTSHSSVVKESDEIETAKALMHAAKTKFNLSDQDCYDMGGEAIAHLGLAAIHADLATQTGDRLKQLWHASKFINHSTAATAHAINNQTVKGIKALANEAYEKLDRVVESCDDPDCLLADPHSHEGDVE